MDELFGDRAATRSGDRAAFHSTRESGRARHRNGARCLQQRDVPRRLCDPHACPILPDHPWIFQKAGERGRSGTQLLAWSTRNERLLIETLRAGGDEEGLIGREAGIKVKTLPSTIYWSSLQRYGILRVGASIEQVAASAGRKASIEGAITEQVDQSDQLWDPYLSPAPAGFPNLDSYPACAEITMWCLSSFVSPTNRRHTPRRVPAR